MQLTFQPFCSRVVLASWARPMAIRPLLANLRSVIFDYTARKSAVHTKGSFTSDALRCAAALSGTATQRNALIYDKIVRATRRRMHMSVVIEIRCSSSNINGLTAVTSSRRAVSLNSLKVATGIGTGADVHLQAASVDTIHFLASQQVAQRMLR